MSTDSTELTFVRCPSCRSLVPAVSTRCRMCGVALDPTAQDDAAKSDSSKGNRVRQRTMAQKGSELSVAANRIREELGANTENEELDEHGADPLSDYIEESKVENKDATNREAKRHDQSNGEVSASAPGTPTKTGVRSDMGNTHIIERTKAAHAPGAEGIAAKGTSDAVASIQGKDKVKGVVPYRRDDNKGRLFGWLVNYSNPDGVSNELREGRFFVSSKNLKENDLLIDDSSISTPHAFVSITAEQGLKIQDLMSDRGVFLRKKNADTYQRVAEAFNVEHGDWVRFGDVEFLVCIVAHFAVK